VTGLQNTIPKRRRYCVLRLSSTRFIVHRGATDDKTLFVGRTGGEVLATIEKVVATANLIREERYPGAIAVFLAGSYIRGEATVHSDLDLVVVFDKLPSAYRESLRFGKFPIETFVHDPETLRYFILEVDRVSGIPALPQMIVEGIEIPKSNSVSRSLKEFAASVLREGPPELTADERTNRRYVITDLVDDLRRPRSMDEAIATGSRLYAILADYYLRANGCWSASGKSIPRALQHYRPDFYERYTLAFRNLFQGVNTKAVIDLAEEVLKPDGGFLFEGYRLHAPQHWRKSNG
jgi:hypothetical protein